jgi:hypothetical protein
MGCQHYGGGMAVERQKETDAASECRIKADCIAPSSVPLSLLRTGGGQMRSFFHKHWQALRVIHAQQAEFNGWVIS